MLQQNSVGRLQGRGSRSLSASGGSRVAAAMVLACAAAAWAGPTFYVSPNGSDNADGLTPQTAWKSLTKVSSTSFTPGSSILFQGGGQWRGQQLFATSSGTVDAPITYGSYGTGAKPMFYGSEVLNKSAFQPVAGTASTFVMPVSKTIGSVLASGTFLRDSQLNTNHSNDPAVNRAFVNSTPNSYYYDAASQSLYVNTGGAVLADPRQFTGVVRDDVVKADGRNNLVFKNLVVNEAAGYNLGGSGYGFNVHATSNVRIEDSEAYRCGKHSFGTTNSTGFVGNNLTAKYLQPDQGIGGASPFVAYNEPAYAGGTYSLNNIHVSDVGDASYPAWVSHGDTGRINLTGFTSIGSSINLSGNTTGRNLRVTDAGATAGPGDVIDGLWMTGKGAQLNVFSNATVRNMVIDKYVFEAGYPAPIVSSGSGSTIDLSTVTFGKQWWSWVSLIAFNGAGTDLTVRGTIFDSSLDPTLNPTVLYDAATMSRLHSDYSLFSSATFFTDSQGRRITFDQWKALTGGDLNSDFGSAGFIDAQNGDYRRLVSSLGVDAIPYGEFPVGVTDFDGTPRPQGRGIDIGAFEVLVPEPGATMAMGLLGTGFLARRRR